MIQLSECKVDRLIVARFSRVMFCHYRVRKIVCYLALLLLTIGGNRVAAQEDELGIALSLADTLRAARTVIARNQDLINNPADIDKDLGGGKIVQDILAIVREKSGKDLTKIDPLTTQGQLLQALLQSTKEIMDENQRDINAPGVGFKGFVPAVFAQLVNERFGEKVRKQARMKVTAPTSLVRNRKARPDMWERDTIENKFSSPDWPRGELYSEIISSEQETAFRVMVPEYYGDACLTCHGSPKGEIDITGYPKEGGKFGDLGGAISITLIR